jgi:hypothetical protein
LLGWRLSRTLASEAALDLERRVAAEPYSFQALLWGDLDLLAVTSSVWILRVAVGADDWHQQKK